jgi:hypothetical protein
VLLFFSVIDMNVKHLTTYKNCQTTKIAPKDWAELNRIQKAVCYERMGWKSQPVKEFLSDVMIYHCCTMSILSCNAFLESMSYLE